MLPSIPIFENGVPEKVDAKEFLRHHLANFPKLSDDETIVQEALDAVYTMFSGVETIWSNNERAMWYSKTRLCYRLLTAWYIADMYPKYVSGIPTMGGIPLKAKKIGDVAITFADSAVSSADGNFKDRLGMLKSNPFGGKAYLMITSSISANRLRQ